MGSKREMCPECGGPLWRTYYREITTKRYSEDGKMKSKFVRMPVNRFYCQSCKREWKLHPVD